jgi:hypothetical protein
MAKIFFANGTDGTRAINLDLIQWASKNADGDVFLHFGKDDDNLTLSGKNADNCWEVINQMWLDSGRLGVPAESRTARPVVGPAAVSNYSGQARARMPRS